MPRRRSRLDERTLFAILLIEFGVIIPLLSAFTSPASISPPPSAAVGRLPATKKPQATDQPPLLIVHVPTVDAVQPPGERAAPTAASGVLPVEAAPAPPQATLTNTPEPLAAVLGPFDSAAPLVPTLLPTVVGAELPAELGVGPPPP